ncbi:MAG TPA: hypothetical protein VIN61_02020 [Gammaproteobacteria bacterium]
MKISGTRAARPWGTVFAALSVPFVSHAAGTIEIDETRWVSIGAGLRAGFVSTEDAAPSGEDRSSTFNIQSVRLYVSGQAAEKVKFTFNTECEGCVFGDDSPIGSGGNMDVLDAIAQFELSEQLNIWIGRMLTPADRIELNGPYYGLNWNQYTVPLLPSDQLGQAGLLGRDDGVTLWGSAGKFQYAFGLFDGVDGGPNVEDNLLFATRLAYNFLEKEQNPGYYTSGTYFGTAGDIFTLALAFQSQSDAVGTAAAPDDFRATIVDMLYENAFDNGAALTIDAEYKTFDADVSPLAAVDPSCLCYLFDGDAYYATFAYLLPGGGKLRWQPYVRYTSNEPDSGLDSDLTEVGLNIVIRGHDARLNVSFLSGDANLTGLPGPDVDTIQFGVQVQI